MKEKLRFDGKINSYTISRTADKWFVSIQLEATDRTFDNSKRGIIGVDVGVKSMIVTSEGHSFEARYASFIIEIKPLLILIPR
jgi:putative transposase